MDDEEDNKKALARLFAPISSSSESEEEEVEVVPERRGFLDGAMDIGLLKPNAGMRIPEWDQFKRHSEIHALGFRRSALEKNNKDAQAALLKSQEATIHTLLIGIKPQLQPENKLELPVFMELFKGIAIEQMRKVENERLTAIGKDLYIMAGMMAGVFRADEEFRCVVTHNQVLRFEMHNYHAEAEIFLINEKLQATDRRQAEKRKIADEEEDLRKMIEAEEMRREEEEMDEVVKRENDTLLELAFFDTYRYHLLLANGWPEEEADALCRKEAKEKRIYSQREIEIRSSPPRSEVDPDDVALDLEAIALEDEYNVYTPRPCPSAQINPMDIFAAAAAAEAAHGPPVFIKNEPEDVEMYDASEYREEYVLPSEQRERSHGEESIVQPRSPTYGDDEEGGVDYQLRSPTYGDEDQEEGRQGTDDREQLRSPTYGEEEQQEDRRGSDHREQFRSPTYGDEDGEAARVDHPETQQRQSRGDHVSRHTAYQARKEQQQWINQARDAEPPREENYGLAEMEAEAAAAAAAMQRAREEQERSRKKREEQQAREQEQRAARMRASLAPALGASSGGTKEKGRGRNEQPEPQLMSAVARQLELEKQKLQKKWPRARSPADDAPPRNQKAARVTRSRTASREASPDTISNKKDKRREKPKKQVVVPAAVSQQQQPPQKQRKQPPATAPILIHPPSFKMRPRSKERKPMTSASREASPAWSQVHHEEPECVEMAEVEQEEDDGEFPPAPLEAYKQQLNRNEMQAMLKERMKKEKAKRKGTLKDVEEISSGQKDNNKEFHNYVRLGHFEGEAVYERSTMPVDRGVLQKKPSILKKNLGGGPALLTDLHAHRMKADDPASRRAQQALLNKQRYHAFNPQKKVTFRDANDPLHQIRCYSMQAAQVPPEVTSTRKYAMDATDDGYDKFHLTKPMTWLKELLESVEEKWDREFPGRYLPHTAIENRCVAGDVHVAPPNKDRLKNPYLCGPITIPVSKGQDVIYTPVSALLTSQQKGDNEYRDYVVSHRDHHILRAMKPMTDIYMEKIWLPQLRLYTRDAFGCDLNKTRLGKKAVCNSGLSHLIFADSLLDRVNTYRFPQSYFIIHQHPLTLSSSFRVLCNEIPLEKLVNIEWFIFAYGFDEVVFEGEAPQIAAERVIQHVQATMQLYYDAVELVRKTHRCTQRAQFRVFTLPTHGMDWEITEWIDEFNGHLKECELRKKEFVAEHQMESTQPLLYTVVDWETPEIVKTAKTLGVNEMHKMNADITRRNYEIEKWNAENNTTIPEIQKREFRFSCIDSFAQSTNINCEMRTARPLMRSYANEYHRKRLTAEVHGLSKEEHDRYY